MKSEIDATSEVIQTARGPVEFSKKGQAPFILAFHGAPGSHDGYSGEFDFWLNNGFGVIAPSRPGYGRTPLDNGKTYADSVDTMAALLDELKIDNVVVMGVSAGGPTAYTFA